MLIPDFVRSKSRSCYFFNTKTFTSCTVDTERPQRVTHHSLLQSLSEELKDRERNNLFSILIISSLLILSANH